MVNSVVGKRSPLRTGIRTPGLLALLAMALVALAGCGAGKAKPAPTRAGFAAEADAICAWEGQKLARAAAYEQAPVQSFSEVPRLIRQAVVIREAADAKLEALRAPTGEATQIGRWLTARTVAGTFEHDLGEAPAREELTAGRDIREQFAKTDAYARTLAAREGLQGCAAAE